MTLKEFQIKYGKEATEELLDLYFILGGNRTGVTERWAKFLKKHKISRARKIAVTTSFKEIYHDYDYEAYCKGLRKEPIQKLENVHYLSIINGRGQFIIIVVMSEEDIEKWREENAN